jgi:hypothetical protein
MTKRSEPDGFLDWQVAPARGATTSARRCYRQHYSFSSHSSRHRCPKRMERSEHNEYPGKYGCRLPSPRTEGGRRMVWRPRPHVGALWCVALLFTLGLLHLNFWRACSRFSQHRDRRGRLRIHLPLIVRGFVERMASGSADCRRRRRSTKLLPRLWRHTVWMQLRCRRATTPALTCLWVGLRIRVPGARQGFVFALLGIPLSERLIRNAVRPHFFFPERPGFGARGLAAEPIDCGAWRAEFNAGRSGDEVHLPASIAHHTHMDGHASDYGTTEP